MTRYLTYVRPYMTA